MVQVRMTTKSKGGREGATEKNRNKNRNKTKHVKEQKLPLVMDPRKEGIFA